MGLVKISDKSLGAWIRSFHFMSPFLAMVIISIGNPMLVLLAFGYTVIAASLFVLWKECFLSIQEQRLLKDDVYGIDLFLEIIGMQVNTDTRYKGTISFAIFYYFTLVMIIEYRFKILRRLLGKGVLCVEA